MTETDLDGIRGIALDRIEKAEKTYKWLFVGAGFCELLGLVLFFVFADLSDNLHVLLLITACLIYWTLGMAIIGLGAFIHLSTQRVLRSIELHAGGEEP